MTFLFGVPWGPSSQRFPWLLEVGIEGSISPRPEQKCGTIDRLEMNNYMSEKSAGIVMRLLT